MRKVQIVFLEEQKICYFGGTVFQYKKHNKAMVKLNYLFTSKTLLLVINTFLNSDN